MQKNNKRINIVIFGFGFMGNSVYENFVNNKLFSVKGLILPKANQFYYSNILKKKLIMKLKFYIQINLVIYTNL